MQPSLIFKKKKAVNDSSKFRIEKEIHEHEENKIRERNRAAVTELQDVAKAERQAQQRKKQEIEMRDNARNRDYLDVLRAARAVEYRELNRALEDKEKLRQIHVAESICKDKEEVHKIQEDREEEWKRLDLERQNYSEGNRTWREDKYQRELQKIDNDKTKYDNRNVEEEKKEKELLQWVTIADESSQPKYNYLPKAVEDELTSRLLQTDINEDEEYEYKERHYTSKDRGYSSAEAAERRRPYISAVPASESHLLKTTTREVDKEIEEARRTVTDAVMNRAKSHRRTYLK